MLKDILKEYIENYIKYLNYMWIITWHVMWATAGIVFMLPIVHEFYPLLGYPSSTLTKISITSWIIFLSSLSATITWFSKKRTP